MFSKTILGNADERRTKCEISDETGTTIAVVYESHVGWHVNVLRALRFEELASFDALSRPRSRAFHTREQNGHQSSSGDNCGCLESLANTEE